MTGRNQLVDSLIAVAQGRDASPPADHQMIWRVEQQFDIELPEDMAAFYLSMDGMQWPTVPEHGWVRIWSLGSWRRVRDEAGLNSGSSNYDALGHAIIVADHCDESWWYAADFRQPEVQPGFFLVDGLRPAKLVARGLSAFVAAVLADSVDIYPEQRSAG